MNKPFYDDLKEREENAIALGGKRCEGCSFGWWIKGVHYDTAPPIPGLYNDTDTTGPVDLPTIAPTVKIVETE